MYRKPSQGRLSRTGIKHINIVMFNLDKKMNTTRLQEKKMATLFAGASQFDISPKDSQHLAGYPHVKRYSTGVHDPLLSSALYIANGCTEVLFIANDILYIGNAVIQSIRNRISVQTGIPASNIMVTSTHTHSGPKTLDFPTGELDGVIPRADPKYVLFLEDMIIKTGVEAHKNTQPARIGLAVADAHGIGTNRRSPDGPSDLQVPVLLVQSEDGKKNIACMLVCSMHPTVIHEDLTLVSGDFPAFSRMFLQQNVLGSDCVVLHHTGTAGNQSPRHVTRSNTFEEARRLGEILGSAVTNVIPNIHFERHLEIKSKSVFIDPPRKIFLSVESAEQKLNNAIAKFENLKSENASRQATRTAECDVFGAERAVTHAKTAADGRLARAYESVLPAEIHIIKLGRWAFVGWPGEVFVEYALEIKKQFADTFVITYANGILYSYIVTKEAADEGGYEASNALFTYETGNLLVEKTSQLLREI